MKQLHGSILIPQKGGLGARHLSSALQKEYGCPPKLYFLNKILAHSLYSEKELMAIKNEVEKDDWIGISVAAIGLERTRQLTRLFKTDPRLASKPLLVGGVQAFATPAMFYEMGADAVCHQEGEIWLPAALRMLEAGLRIPMDFETETPRHDIVQPPDYDFTKGMHYVLEDGAIRRIASAEKEFAAIPNCSISGQQHQLWLFTDRRCRFSCSYCVNHKLKTFDRTHGGPPGRLSTPKLLGQIMELTAKYPLIDSVVFFDDDFLPRFLDGKTLKQDELALFCSAWKKDIAKPFFIYFSPMTFNEEILNALMDAGLRKVNFGYPTVSREALRHYRRTSTPFERIKHITGFTVRNFKLGKLEVPDVDFLINSPFETAQDMRRTIEAVLELTPPFDTQMHNLRLFPGYELTETFASGAFSALPGYKTILDREFQDHAPHAEWLWPNITDDRAYYTILQMLMGGLCTDEMLGVLKRSEMGYWINLPPEERTRKIPDLLELFNSNPRIRAYNELAGVRKPAFF